MALTFAIDPGNTHSAYVVLTSDNIIAKGILPNDDMRLLLREFAENNDIVLAIEMIASYGMAVGSEVFNTCVWIGRYIEQVGRYEYVYRKDVKMNLCGSMRAKDSNIRQALLDRFGKERCKGLAKDMWSALAVGVTYLDRKEKE
jgi:hypothetical protein